VIYLDSYHVSVDGSHAIRGPLLDLLNRILGPNDMFAVMTPKMRSTDLVFVRKTLGIEEQLTKYWPWGERNRITRDQDDPGENDSDVCFTYKKLCPGDLSPPVPIEVVDDGATRLLKDVLIDRRREDRVITHLGDVIRRLSEMRETRTTVLAVTDGWRLFKPDHRLDMKVRTCGDGLARPGIGTVNGTVTMTPVPGYVDDAACNTELLRLASLDDDTRFRDVIDLANRHDVVFYPINPSGLEVFDTTLAQTPLKPDPANPYAPVSAVDLRWHRERVNSVLTLAGATDGIAVVDTNDLRGGLMKIANDVSAYYLIGYYSTNAKMDGKLRKIQVRVKQPSGTDVIARRGYVAGTAGAVYARADAAPTAASPASTTGFADALGVMSRQSPSADLLTYAVVAGTEIAVVAEIASRALGQSRWTKGGDVSVTVTPAAGGDALSGKASIDPGMRGAIVRIQMPAGATGPWRATVKLTSGPETLDDRVEVHPATGAVLGEPLAFRGTPSARSALQAVADFTFRRTERAHLEIAVPAPLDQRQARLLDQKGQPLPLEATVTERDDGGHRTLAVDLNLAPLGPGDYVFEITGAAGGKREQRFVAIRVVR
jgi:VWFA-related protein